MKKQLEVNGDKIIVESISTDKKNKTKVTFTNGKTISLNDEAFLSYYLYPKKELSLYEYNEIISKNNDENYETYIKNLISKKTYSSQELINKLVTIKHLNLNDSQKIINSFIKQGLIDDLTYAKNIKLELSNKGYSKEGIKNYLSKKGIDSETINNILNDVSTDTTAIINSLRKIIDKNSSNSYLMTIQNIKVELFKKGYSQNEIEQIIDECKFKYPYLTSNEREYLALIKESKKYYDKIIKVNSNSSEKLLKFKKHLLNKGFKLEDIEYMIRKEGYNFD